MWSIKHLVFYFDLYEKVSFPLGSPVLTEDGKRYFTEFVMGSEWKKIILLDNTIFEVEGTHVHIFTIVHKRQNTEGIWTEKKRY